MINSRKISFPGICMMVLFMISCSSSKELTEPMAEKLSKASISPGELLESVPNYKESLQTISGSGRAFVSEPGNSDRVTLQFLSNRKESLIKVRTSVGIEGGQIYVDGDSLLIYNRVDKEAEKVPLRQGKLSSVGSIASVNLLDLFNFTITQADIDRLYESEDYYVAVLANRARVQISKSTGRIIQVVQAAENRQAPYSRIEYEGYADIENFYLPRRITIFSNDGKSKATLLVRRLSVNKALPELGIDIPEDIQIKRSKL